MITYWGSKKWSNIDDQNMMIHWWWKPDGTLPATWDKNNKLKIRFEVKNWDFWAGFEKQNCDDPGNDDGDGFYVKLEMLILMKLAYDWHESEIGTTSW